MNTTELIKLHAKIPLSSQGLRVDQAAALLFPQHSRARIQDWIKMGYLTLDNSRVKTKNKVHGGETLEVAAPMPKTLSFEPEDIALNIVYEDQDLLIINKPPGLVVHPAAGNLDGTLLNALLHHSPNLKSLPRAGIVHRLDKDTSGIMMVAKTLEAHTYLVKSLQQRQVSREYYALVQGVITAGNTIEQPIGRHPTQRTKMAVNPKGKAAITHFRILEKFSHHTLLKVNLETGRTHQIRVHLAHLGFPIVGDKTYGSRLIIPRNISQDLQSALRQFPRQALHAKSLQLVHPSDLKIQKWSTDLPEDIEQLLLLLRA